MIVHVVITDWLLDGLAGFLTDMFIKQFLGNNEARYRRYKANCAVCKADDSGAMCLSSSPSCRDLFGTHSIGMHGKIRSWKSGAVLQMLEKQMGSDSFRKVWSWCYRFFRKSLCLFSYAYD
jgi:transcription initiation factor TFIID subunit 2